VAMGPVDALNSVLINSIVFAFVPMLTACREEERTALFLKLSRCFSWALAAISAALMLVGSDTPLTVMMYGRMREGATPVLNAVSLFLMVASALLAFTLMRGGSSQKPAPAA